jgi:hypothetical protein
LKRNYETDREKFMQDLEIFPESASDAEKDAFDARWYDLERRREVVARLEERRPGDTFLAAEAAGLTSEDLLSEAEGMIAEQWEKKKFTYPTNEVSALLYGADLMSTEQIVTPDAVAFALEHNISTVEELFDADKEGTIRLDAAGFGKLVGINLGWGNTLLEGFDSAYSSLDANVLQIEKLGREKLAFRDGTEKEVRDNQRSGAVLRTISTGDGATAQYMVNKLVRNRLNELVAEKGSPTLEAYESRLLKLREAKQEIADLNDKRIEFADLKHIGLDMLALKAEIAELKPLYVQESMFLLLEAGFEVNVATAREVREFSALESEASSAENA